MLNAGRLFIFCATMLVSACANLKHVADRAAEYNEAVEWNTNTVMLMNVVRASKGLPMHYTRLGSMTYERAVSANAGLTYTFGNDTAEDAPLELGAMRTEGGNINFINQNDEKFFRAILASVKPETLSFYRDQGWPTDVVLFTLIERIEMSLRPADAESLLDQLCPSDEPTTAKCRKGLVQECRTHIITPKNERETIKQSEGKYYTTQIISQEKVQCEDFNQSLDQTPSFVSNMNTTSEMRKTRNGQIWLNLTQELLYSLITIPIIPTRTMHL